MSEKKQHNERVRADGEAGSVPGSGMPHAAPSRGPVKRRIHKIIAPELVARFV